MAVRERKNHCIQPGCNVRRGKNGRGLCDRHHLELYKQVRDGKTTWDRLEAQGRCLPVQSDTPR